ncbi:MAG: hypothetical protein HFJ58_05530 [Clostridia bacterium]|nr:hypothetical protein [Clostridia bacterium]
MTKMVITEKRLSKKKVDSVVRGHYQGKFTIRYKRGQIFLFFPGKDLDYSQVQEISKDLGMQIISKSFVRAVIGY